MNPGYTVVGRGFGLYGHCASILSSAAILHLWNGYRERVEARPELRGHAGRIIWQPSIAACLAEASDCIIAVPPAEQPAVLAECLAHANLLRLGLEKPLANDPGAARQVLERLRDWGGSYRIDYTFLHAAWLQDAVACAANARAPLTLEWRFCAHHYRHGVETWKRVVTRGGGALRFYGIHCIALAARLGYTSAAWSRTVAVALDEAETWNAQLCGPGLPDLRILVDSRAADESFRFCADGSGPVVALAHPFAAESVSGADDPRCAPLGRFIATLVDGADALATTFYRNCQALWERIEQANEHRRQSCAG